MSDPSVFLPIASLIARARARTPSIDAIRATATEDPYAVETTIPAIFVHILTREIEQAYAEIARLENALLLATTPRGAA